MYDTNRPMSDEDVVKMLELGWFPTDANLSDEETEWSPKHYTPCSGWSCYT